MALCPKCDVPLVKAGNCTMCGWNRKAEAAMKHDNKPPMPTLEDAHRVVVSEIIAYRGPRPEKMPADNLAAAKWLLNHVLEKHQPEEAPQLKNKTEGRGEAASEKCFWVWPYLTRLKIQSRQFLHLSPDYQRYIIAAKEDGIPWRGDEEWLFRKVVAEHQRMMEIGVDAYRKEVMAKMRGLLSATKRKTEAA